jgi:RNA polymerase-binding transcription factor DksA
LLDEIAHCRMPIQERPTTVHHMANDATQVTEQTTAFALRHHLEELLTNMDHAVVRAEKGMYGVCEQRGHPISAE